MKKLSAALLFYLGLASAALAQTFSMPPPAGVTVVGCVYNLSPPTLLTATAGFMQCDSTGKLIISGGGGGAVTIADGADVAEGATTDAASTAGGIGTVSSKLRLMTTQLGTINTTLGSPFQAGGSIANTAFGISGTLPAYAATPTFNIGTAPTIAVTGAFFQATQPVSGSVAVTSVIPGTAATNLGKAEDAAHVSGDTGVFGLALANEAQTVLAQDGDYIGHGVDTKGNAFITGPVASGATDSGNPVKIGGVYNSAVQAFTNGKRADLQVDQRGGLLIQDGQAIPSVSVTSATTLFTVADTSGYGSISVQVTSAGTACTITYEASEDGTTWSSVNGYSPTTTSVTITTTTTVSLNLFPLTSKMFRARVSTYGSGTVTVQGTLKKDALTQKGVAVSNLTNATFVVVGPASEAGGTGSNLFPTVSEARTTNKTAVATGLYVRPIATSIGVAVNKPFQVPELDWSYPAAAGGISNTTTAVTMVGAAGSGIRNYLTAIQVSAGALGAASEIAVRDGAGGTVIWRGFLSTAGGNQSVNLSSPIKSTANTLLEVVTLTATITGAVYINAQGYQAP